MSLEDKIKEIIADCLAVDEQDIRAETRLSDCGADSLDLLDLAYRLERKFDIPITLDEDITFQELLDLIHREKLNEGFSSEI